MSMKVTKTNTETYVITNVPRLDPVTVYVTNYEPGKGKIVVECYGSTWSTYWGGMSGGRLQPFFVGCDNAYIANRFVSQCSETDFDKVAEMAKEKGFDICAANSTELALMSREMRDCFGSDWIMDLPTRSTSEYGYACRVIDAVREAFKQELNSSVEVA